MYTQISWKKNHIHIKQHYGHWSLQFNTIHSEMYLMLATFEYM